jgi:hypothetical protein
VGPYPGASGLWVKTGDARCRTQQPRDDMERDLAGVRFAEGGEHLLSCRADPRRSRSAAVHRNPPLRRGDGEEPPLAGHALKFMSATIFELDP